MNSIIADILAQGKATCYLITSPVNIAYVTGFFGEDSQLLMSGHGAFLFTDSRYEGQARRDAAGVRIVVTSAAERNESICSHLPVSTSLILGIEEQYMTVADFDTYRKDLDIHNHVDISEMLLEMRCFKTAGEIDDICVAAQATQDVLSALLEHIRPGVRECDLRARLLYEICSRGMDSAFDPIVAGGPNSAIPHARVSEYALRSGDLLTLDFGCRYRGYCADMTRTFAIGHIDDDLKTIYDVVQQAQKQALDAAEPGIEAARIDGIARSFISDHGYGEYFGHGTGHGVGLQIHELPIVNASSTAVLAEGMVFTVEPGIYLPGRGGVRIEDTCVAGRGSLFSFPKNLIEL